MITCIGHLMYVHKKLCAGWAVLSSPSLLWVQLLVSGLCEEPRYRQINSITNPVFLCVKGLTLKQTKREMSGRAVVASNC